ncbi:MAG: AIR synthase related protein [Melioribacteraceae bacterium]
MLTDLLLEKYNVLKKENNSEAFKTRRVRDLLITELTEYFWMITTCDSDGGIGPKKQDTVFSPAYDLGRLAARVPIMEMLSSGALPVLVVDTLCVEMDPVGKEIIRGVRDEVSEAGLNGDLVLTGSTEDNVVTYQTGVGVVVVGFVEKKDFRPGRSFEGDLVVCLGVPKSAPEYKVHYADNGIANTKLIKQLNSFDFIHDILPIGSKGISHEFRELAKSANLSPFYYEGITLDITKSGGPSTCCLVSLQKNKLDLLKDKIDKPITLIGELRKRLNV